jgi:hypothetical protein
MNVKGKKVAIGTAEEQVHKSEGDASVVSIGPPTE